MPSNVDWIPTYSVIDIKVNAVSFVSEPEERAVESLDSYPLRDADPYN